MATFQLLLVCGFFTTVINASILNYIFSSNVKRPVHVRTLKELKNRSSDEFVVLDFVGLVEQYEGYAAEEYKVTTDDGYILGLHRITASPKSPKADNKSVVYIAHGFIGSSDVMVNLGPQRSIAFELADAGYDVWLGNLRGNTYSRSHTKYSADNDRFWNFSMDEGAFYDISKLIDFVLESSKQTKLTYIGYSMGTTLSYMLLSAKPEYNEKINLIISLAPAVLFLEPINWKIEFYYAQPLLWRAYITSKLEMLPQNGELAAFAIDSCSSNESNICASTMSNVVTTETMDLTTIPTILTYVPAGTSCNIIKHYIQLIHANGTLQKFNSHGYGSNLPAEYDLTKVTVPNVILYGKNDYLVRVVETEYLKNKLSNVVVFEAIADDKFNHLDFLWSTKSKTLVYDRVINIMSDLL